MVLLKTIDKLIKKQDLQDFTLYLFVHRQKDRKVDYKNKEQVTRVESELLNNFWRLII